MAHEHHHNGDHHHHHHAVTLTNVNSAFIIGIALNFAFVILEVIYGLIIHSLSLLSDAGHNLADVGSLGLSLLAFKLLKVKSNDKYTYGYRKTSILVALFNAMVLMVSIGAIIYEGFHRLFDHEKVPGLTISIVAAIGIVVNFSSAIIFRRDKEKDLNVKSAYLHLMADAVISLGLVAGGIIIYYTNWYWIDPALSLVVAAIILVSTWRLLRDSLRLSLDGVPENIDVANVREAAIKITGVKDLHHIHVWAISTTENALTAHLVLQNNVSVEQEKHIKNDLRHRLQHLNIHHVTLETERENEHCAEQVCDVSTV
ncbi:MAG TPA: cation diffusion facilitator family transporter [Chitinophagaceae bacterium]|nr:cation diffusion facilitator family transporter [Chitinophagaceae bacterium]